MRDDGKCRVELHWKITPKYFSFPLDFEHLWERLERVSLNGREALTLSSEDFNAVSLYARCQALLGTLVVDL